MTEKMGLEAVLVDDQFMDGLKNYMAGIANATKANIQAAISFVKFGGGIDDVGDELKDTGDDAVKHVARIERLEKAYGDARQVIETGIGLAELGAQFDRQEHRFAAFAEAAGGAEANLAAFQRGAGGTVNKMEAMSSASRLLQMGLVQDAGEMEKVVEMATRLGDQTASAGVRVSDFALMLANTSIPRLDSYGISAGYVRDRMKELQAASADTTREQAFAQAVFEAGADSLAVLGERVEDSAAEIERARAKIEDARIEMGQNFAPAVASAASMVAGLESSTLALVAALTGAIGIAAKFSGGFGNLAKSLGMSGKQMGVLGAELAALVVAIEFAQNRLTGMRDAEKEASEAAKSMGDQVDELVASGMSLDEAMDAMSGKINKATDAWHNASDAEKAAIAILGQSGEYTKAMTEATQSLSGAVLDNTSSYAEYIKQIEEYNSSITDSEGKIRVMTEAQYEWGMQWVRSAEAADEAIERHTKWLDDAADATEKFNREQGRRVAGQQTANEVTEEDTKTMQRAVEAREDLAEAAEEYQKHLEEEKQAQEEAARAAQEHTTALLEQAETLSDADAAKAAKAAIAGLTDLLKEGAISLEEYDALVRGVQDDYGLAGAEGRALAEGIAELSAALAGGMPLEEYRAQLDALIGSQVESIEATKAQAEAQEELEEEARRVAEEIEKLAESISRGAVQAALAELEEQFDSGKIAFGEYVDQIEGVYKRYGLVTDESHALAERIDELNTQFASGAISLTTYQQQLEDLISAQGGSTKVTREQLRAQQELGELTEQIRRDVEREMKAAASAAEELPGKLFDALSALGSTAMRTLQDEMKPLDEELRRIDEGLEVWKRALEDPTADLQDQETALAKIRELEDERAQIAAERAEQEERILAFQEAQQQMALLQQQLDLLELVQQHGLDAQQILGGLTADASASDIVEATTEAMNQIIEQIGAGTQTMTQAPVYAAPTQASGNTSTQYNTFDLGGNNIYGGMDAAQLEAMIRRVMAEAING